MTIYGALTDHARKRMQQRGISSLQTTLLEVLGVFKDQKGGDQLGSIDARKLRELRQAIDRLEGVLLVTSGRGTAITAMHRTRRIHTV